MRTSYSYIYVHLIWSTWKRMELINLEIESILYKLISDKLYELKCQPIKIGGTKDHIHILVNIHPSVSVSTIVKEVKGFSSFIIANKIQPESLFRWQSGYGVISISPQGISRISEYITDQKEHHREGTMKSNWELEPK